MTTFFSSEGEEFEFLVGRYGEILMRIPFHRVHGGDLVFVQFRRDLHYKSVEVAVCEIAAFIIEFFPKRKPSSE